MVEIFIYNQATAFQLRVYGEGDAPLTREHNMLPRTLLQWMAIGMKLYLMNL